MTGVALVVSLAMLTTSCHKDETNNNGSNNGNTENPGGGGSGGGSGTQDQFLPNAVTDIDGNHYDAVQIGDQVWMAENLRTTKYADGTTLPLGTSTSTTTAYRYAPGTGQSNEENMDNVSRYGYLYNWPAVMHGESSSTTNPSGVQGICPNGWHVPSGAEWTQLKTYLRSHSEYVCSGSGENIAKALASTSGWQSYDGAECAVGNNLSTNNSTGFSALPAGIYYGGYDNFGYGANFWTAAVNVDGIAAYYNLYYSYATVGNSCDSKYYGFSVRCVRD